MVRILIIFSLLLSSIVISGCESENPNPELLDPVYKTLSAKSAALKAKIAAEEKGIETLKVDLKETDVLGLQRPQFRKELSMRVAALDKLRQLERYHDVRAESRKAYVKKEYKAAFKAKKPWPPPDLEQEYSTMERLRNAPRQWSRSVPSLENRTPAGAAAPHGEAEPPSH